MRAETPALLGQRVGNIRVVDVLGEGGMGAVYVGLDEKLQRRVALKAMRAEYRLHEEAKARFLREARILSQLDHPHICTVHELIEGEDCDFLVLELIQGMSLREAMEGELDHSTKLGIARQLLEVLGAVHGRGVIHRDLKPENVMVTEADEIKVLDFGLSRSLDEEAATPPLAPTRDRSGVPAGRHQTDETVNGSEGVASTYVKTELGTVLGTLGYMSPEQARGEPATAASDMYSLGLILHELFTGQPPFESGLPRNTMLLRAAEAQTRPVTGLPPDLTAFIERLKSAAPGARPSSLDALAQLEAIIDKPRRRRRQRIVASVWMALSFLSVALAVAAVLAVKAAVRASREAETVRQVSDFLVELFQVSDPSESRGNTITAREILDRGAERIEQELAGEPLVQARLMDTLGFVYCELGLYEQATPLLERALELRMRHLGDEHLDVAVSLDQMARLLYYTGDYHQAEALYRESLAMRRRLLGNEHSEVAESLNNLGVLLVRTGDYDEAERMFREALELNRRLLGDEHLEVATSLNNLAAVLQTKHDYDAAEQLFRESLTMRRRLFGDDSLEVAGTLNNLALLQQRRGDSEAAEPLYREAIATYRRLFPEGHPHLAGMLNNLAKLLFSKEDLDAAEPLFREAAAMRRRLLGDEHPDVSVSLYDLAWLLEARGDTEAAEPIYREALAIREKTYPPGHRDLQRARAHYASLLRDLGRTAEAEELESRAAAATADGTQGQSGE